MYWLYLGGVYPVCKSEASSHRSAGRPHKNIDREGAREGEFLSRISTNKKASSAIQNDVGSERNGVELFHLLIGALSFHSRHEFLSTNKSTIFGKEITMIGWELILLAHFD